MRGDTRRLAFGSRSLAWPSAPTCLRRSGGRACSVWGAGESSRSSAGWTSPATSPSTPCEPLCKTLHNPSCARPCTISAKHAQLVQETCATTSPTPCDDSSNPPIRAHALLRARSITRGRPFGVSRRDLSHTPRPFVVSFRDLSHTPRPFVVSRRDLSHTPRPPMVSKRRCARSAGTRLAQRRGP